MCNALCESPQVIKKQDTDPRLVERAAEVDRERTTIAGVTRAQHDPIAGRAQSRLMALFGTVEWDPHYDYKSERTRRAG